MALLELDEVNVSYGSGTGSVWAVRDVSLSIDRGELVGLVGESGCGKSTLAFAITRLLRPPARLISGRITFNGADVTKLSGEALRRQRRNGFAIVLQSGMNALNPVRVVEDHFADVIRAHERVGPTIVRDRAETLLGKVGLTSGVLRHYPHELSGGMRQRVVVALVLSLQPSLVVFDEPTTALDVITQQRVMETIRSLQHEEGFAALLVSHDLGLVLEFTDRVLVMYAGRIVEDQSANRALNDPQHPYTQALLRCSADPRADEVRLDTIPGSPPDLSQPMRGQCAFQPRCPKAEQVCSTQEPRLLEVGEGRVACFVAQRRKEESHVR